MLIEMQHLVQSRVESDGKERRKKERSHERKASQLGLVTKGAFMVLVITRRLASDDAHAYVCSRRRPFMCTALGI